jgi:putative PIN family toxin of toxin-antitoxin system
MKVVFDSSVWIAGIGSQTGFASDSIYSCCKSEKIEIFISSQILDEVEINLEKKLKFERTQARDARRVIENLCDFAIVIKLTEEKAIKFLKDNNDRHVLALCKKIRADYLVSFDRKHLLPVKQFKQTKILEPREFVKII